MIILEAGPSWGFRRCRGTKLFDSNTAGILWCLPKSVLAMFSKAWEGDGVNVEEYVHLRQRIQSAKLQSALARQGQGFGTPSKEATDAFPSSRHVLVPHTSVSWRSCSRFGTWQRIGTCAGIFNILLFAMRSMKAASGVCSDQYISTIPVTSAVSRPVSVLMGSSLPADHRRPPNVGLGN